MTGSHPRILVDGSLELRLIHWFLGSSDPESPFFQRSKIEHHPVDLVCYNGDKETSNGIDDVVVGGCHDDQQDEERVPKRDHSHEFVGRVDKEGETNHE